MCSTSSIKLEIRNVAAVQSALQRNVQESVQSLLFCLFKLLFLRRSRCRRRCGCLCSVLTHAAHPDIFENEDFLSVLDICPALKRRFARQNHRFSKTISTVEIFGNAGLYIVSRVDGRKRRFTNMVMSYIILTAYHKGMQSYLHRNFQGHSDSNTLRVEFDSSASNNDRISDSIQTVYVTQSPRSSPQSLRIFFPQF